MNLLNPYVIFYPLIIASSHKGQVDILKDLLEYSEKKNKINQDKMNREIDTFTEKNIKEMNEAIEEIKFSYRDDLNDIDGIKHNI